MAGASPKAVTVDVTDVRQSSVNDIALAKLSKPVTGVKTLQLAKQPPSKGDQLTLAGWGATNETHPVPSTQLRYGKVDVSSTTDTTVLVHGSWPHPDMSACTYDSGAPYFSGNTLVSVESTGPGCPHTGDETTSRVDIQTDWIKQEISS